MEHNTGWTPFSDDNLLGLTDKAVINEHEAKGIAKAELLIFQLDSEVAISLGLILSIHKVAFEELYEWAGKWRVTNVTVGQLIPPDPIQVPQLMLQFIDNLNFKISIAATTDTHIDCLTYAHYEFIRIHPFNNGNGRTGRILMNLVALKFGYQPLGLYHREGEGRSKYINAMKAGDRSDFQLLRSLITKELVPF